jgi:hypothetical protein
MTDQVSEALKGADMSLSGNLGFVSIDEILRLLTRSRQQGAVEVTGDALHGRVFVGKGGIDLATTSDNDDLHRHLVNSGYADEKTLNRITNGETTLAAVAESNNSLIELLREMTVESLHQIGAKGADFYVREGASTPYASPKSFELEALLHDTDERSREWAKVNEVVPDLHETLRLRRDLGERDEITVKVDDWRVLSEIGAGSSVAAIADHLGTTEFWAARVASRLVKSELIDLDASVSSEDIEVEEEDVLQAVDHPVPELVSSEDQQHAQYEADDSDGLVGEDWSEGAASAAESKDVAEAGSGEESWWNEPTYETPDMEDGSQTPEVVSEGLSEIPSVEDSDQASDDAAREDVDSESDVEEETEAFLEKVFSELDATEPESGDQGHGLLRRRRMGTLRDFSSDS